MTAKGEPGRGPARCTAPSAGMGWRGPRRPDLLEVCHFARGYGVARNGAAASRSRARGVRAPDTPSGEASWTAGEGGRAATRGAGSGSPTSRLPSGSPPTHSLLAPVGSSSSHRRRRRPLLHPERSCKAEPTLPPRARTVPHPGLRVCEAAAAAAERGAACQVQPPSLLLPQRVHT